MRRAVVNVSTGRFEQGGIRLYAALGESSPDVIRKFWFEIPPGWPTHKEKPYAFKAYALLEASKEADLLLWCDAAVIPVRPLAPLWQRIEEDGYWIAVNGWTNYEWTADSAYADLFPTLSIDAAREINKTFPQILGTSFGLNVRSDIGAAFLEEFYRLAQTNSFCGPWGNTRSAKGPKYHESMMGDCGPADVLGHRHDQTAASMLAWKLKMKLTPPGEFFGYPPATEKTILLAVGA